MRKALPIRRSLCLAIVVCIASAAVPLAAETVSDPAGLIMVLPHAAGSLAQMREEMRQGLVEGGVELMIAGELEQVAKNALGGACEGYVDGQQVKGRTVGAVSPSGGGAYVIADTTPEMYRKELASAADQIAKGMQFPKVDSSDLARNFAGTWVTMSANSETKVTLGLNGQFSLYSESSYSGSFSDQYGNDAGGWGTADSQESQRRWTARDPGERGHHAGLRQWRARGYPGIALRPPPRCSPSSLPRARTSRWGVR